MTLDDFIRQHHITMDTERVARNWRMGTYQADSVPHYRCTFTRPDGRSMETYYSSAIRCYVRDVLRMLRNDAESIERRQRDGYFAQRDDDDLEDWAFYNRLLHQTNALKAFLGADAYRQLLNEVEG